MFVLSLVEALNTCSKIDEGNVVILMTTTLEASEISDNKLGDCHIGGEARGIENLKRENEYIVSYLQLVLMLFTVSK